MHIHGRAHVKAWTAAGFHAYEDALRDRKEDETPGSARMLPCPPEILRASRRHGEGEQADCHDVTNRDFSAVINGSDIRRYGRRLLPNPTTVDGRRAGGSVRGLPNAWVSTSAKVDHRDDYVGGSLTGAPPSWLFTPVR